MINTKLVKEWQKEEGFWTQDWMDKAFFNVLQKAVDYGAIKEQQRYTADLSKLQNPENRKKCLEWLAEGTLIERLIELTFEQEKQLLNQERLDKAARFGLLYGMKPSLPTHLKGPHYSEEQFYAFQKIVADAFKSSLKEISAKADNDSAYAYADGWNACVKNMQTTLANLAKIGNPWSKDE
jgi:hypothetical protein